MQSKKHHENSNDKDNIFPVKEKALRVAGKSALSVYATSAVSFAYWI